MNPEEETVSMGVEIWEEILRVMNPEVLKNMGLYKSFLAQDFQGNKGFWTLNDFGKILKEEVECNQFT